MNRDGLKLLRNQLKGKIVDPGDPDYDQARKVYNGMIDRRPAVIARCVDVADVIAAVRFGREARLRVSIRGGGHNAAGLGVCDDGLCIDLSGIKYVHVDPAARTVRVGGGCVWGDVDHAAHAFGLAVPSGIVSTTGVGGLTLGGGLGHLTRGCGLTIDNLLEAGVVLADGRYVVASAEQNPDLFWALRGGGGNFGVVTSFLFRAHPVHTVTGGPMFWELEHTTELMQWYRDFIIGAPEDLTGFFAFHTIPPAPPFPEAHHLKKMCGIVWCYSGPPEKAEQAFAPVRKLRPAAIDLCGSLPFPALQGMFDGLYPTGLQWYWKADFVKELPDAAIAQHLAFAERLPTALSGMHLYPINGAAHRVGKNETAWSYRDAVWAQVMVGVDPDAANREDLTAWAKGYYEALHPFSAGGAYVNMMMEEGEERIRASYRDNYDRLSRIKAQYDPGNFFNVNQNIRPAA